MVNDTIVSGIPVLGTVVNMAKAAYIIIGGFVGLSVIFFFVKWWDSRMFRKRLARVESMLESIDGKLDKILEGKARKK